MILRVLKKDPSNDTYECRDMATQNIVAIDPYVGCAIERDLGISLIGKMVRIPDDTPIWRPIYVPQTLDIIEEDERK